MINLLIFEHNGTPQRAFIILLEPMDVSLDVRCFLYTYNTWPADSAISTGYDVRTSDCM